MIGGGGRVQGGPGAGKMDGGCPQGDQVSGWLSPTPGDCLDGPPGEEGALGARAFSRALQACGVELPRSGSPLPSSRPPWRPVRRAAGGPEQEGINLEAQPLEKGLMGPPGLPHLRFSVSGKYTARLESSAVRPLSLLPWADSWPGYRVPKDQCPGSASPDSDSSWLLEMARGRHYSLLNSLAGGALLRQALSLPKGWPHGLKCPFYSFSLI